MTVAEGSYDNSFSKYSSSVRVQRNDPDDMVLGIDAMLRELLTEYQSNNGGNCPEHVVIFRDGLTRAQMDTFVFSELAAITKVLDKQRNEIKLTVIVVQKRRVPAPTKQGRRVHFPLKTVIDADVTEEDSDVFDLDDHFKPEVSFNV